MTIKGLSDFINKKYPESKIKLPLKIFAGKRIAIDTPSWIYTNCLKARNLIIDQTDILNDQVDENNIISMCLDNLIRFIGTFISNSILPIFIMDGKDIPEKSEIKKERKTKNEKIELQIEEIRKQIEDRTQQDLLDHCSDLIINLKKKLKSLAKIPLQTYDVMSDCIAFLGIPYIHAIGDAEKLCSILCREKWVAAVFSKDIDCLAFGCPLMIKSFVEKSTEKEVECIRLDYLLNSMNINMTQFMDLSIVIGCDYNEYKNPARLGPGRAFEQIKKYGRVENIELKYDYSTVKLEKCREIFSCCQPLDIMEGRKIPNEFIDSDIDIFDVLPLSNFNFFTEYNIREKLNFILKNLNKVSDSKDGNLEDINWDLISYQELPMITERINPKKKN